MRSAVPRKFRSGNAARKSVMKALMSSRPFLGSWSEYFSNISGAAISSTTPRSQVLPQKSVNQRPTMALLSSCKLMEVPLDCCFEVIGGTRWPWHLRSSLGARSDSGSYPHIESHGCSSLSPVVFTAPQGMWTPPPRDRGQLPTIREQGAECEVQARGGRIAQVQYGRR